MTQIEETIGITPDSSHARPVNPTMFRIGRRLRYVLSSFGNTSADVLYVDDTTEQIDPAQVTPQIMAGIVYDWYLGSKFTWKSGFILKRVALSEDHMFEQGQNIRSGLYQLARMGFLSWEHRVDSRSTREEVFYDVIDPKGLQKAARGEIIGIQTANSAN